MKRNEFLQLIARFSKQPVPATIQRHIYLWLGEADDLFVNSPAGLFKKLDLHQVCQRLEKTPYGDKAAGRELSNAIEDWLSKEFPRDTRQHALLVAGIDLLYRYHLPMSVFMRLASEKCMIVLVLSPLDVNFHPSAPLPAYTQFSPDAILKYVKTELPEEAVVGEE